MDNEDSAKPAFIGPRKVLERRRFIAERLSGQVTGESVKELANLCGESIRTIYDDLDSRECQEAVQCCIIKRATAEGAALAWRNIYKAIVEGDVATSKWLLERLAVFNIEPGDDWDKLLDESLFKGNGHENTEPEAWDNPEAASPN